MILCICCQLLSDLKLWDHALCLNGNRNRQLIFSSTLINLFCWGLFDSLIACITCPFDKLFRWLINSSSISECRFSVIHCRRCMPMISVRSSFITWLTTHSSEREVGRLTSFSADFCVSSSSLSSGTVNVFIDFDDECTNETESAANFETGLSSDSTAFTAEDSENPASSPLP